MIRTIEIENYKSIESASFELGRINVFIGENGAGKSNLLEALSLLSAAAADKLDNEYLYSRGVRVTAPQLMSCQLQDGSDSNPIIISATPIDSEKLSYEFTHDNKAYANWSFTFKKDGLGADEFQIKRFDKYVKSEIPDEEQLNKQIFEFITAAQLVAESLQKQKPIDKSTYEKNHITSIFRSISKEFEVIPNELKEFLIYSPEQSSLRAFDPEGQIQPLGVQGEGLLKLVTVLYNEDKAAITTIKESLQVLGWFSDFTVHDGTSSAPPKLEIFDKFIEGSIKSFDQKSANEGFLFLLFYYALFSSALTPKFFAVDNIDASLNPKLCMMLIKQLVKISEKSGKQAILTTHNPAILDGLNLEDDEQRLFVISRSLKGQTRIKRIEKPKDSNLKLSEMFMRGVLGGLPKDF
ncbi:AAA family ATPase [Pseudomonas sp. NPDC089741]|uniref:AAA family ATPase n=1 Tax=Pseudomonas sp. NPDC089741 TaxID=3364470 RepID=UPI00382FBCC0